GLYFSTQHILDDKVKGDGLDSDQRHVVWLAPNMFGNNPAPVAPVPSPDPSEPATANGMQHPGALTEIPGISIETNAVSPSVADADEQADDSTVLDVETPSA
ncbi:MAG: hypothetical protein ACHQ6U_13870, partial [Thermodesulfobacteriota bacterium]